MAGLDRGFELFEPVEGVAGAAAEFLQAPGVVGDARIGVVGEVFKNKS